MSRKKLRIVGHADQRGADDYNKQLGKSRAQVVVDFLSDEDTDNCRLEVVSKGETGADLSDELGFPFDRRVDIPLAN